MSDLTHALDTLAAARPNPSAVLALAAETERKRLEPYDRKSFQNLANPNDRVARGLSECLICGAVLPWGGEHLHVKFHNDIEARLLKLEGA